MSDIEIRRYHSSMKKEWDEFVESSKNGTFLFNRDYMDYHSDRFQDHSLLFYRKGKLYCLLPANRKDDIVYSHQGLTYGGLIMSESCTAAGILEVFDVLIKELKSEGIKRFIYKPVPYIYHKYPSQEDLYALFRHEAGLTIRNISTTIDRHNPIGYTRLRRRNLIKAEIEEIKITESRDFDTLWPIVERNLQTTYNAKAVHSLDEIKRLAKYFPQNIKLYLAAAHNTNMAVGIFYITKEVIHAQYIHPTPEGKECGGVDALVNYILKETYPEIPYFDFGSSNEDEGRYLNESLIHMKEGFGGRAVCYDTYEIDLQKIS